MKIYDWKSVESMAELPEQLWLENKVAQYQEYYEGKELKILEIGSFKGQSTALLAQFGTVFAIDLWGNVDQGLRNYDEIGTHHFLSFIKNMTRLRLIDRVFPIVSTSKILTEMPLLGFDIIYIDGGHDYEDVRIDLKNSWYHLTYEGLIILDDYKRPGWGYPPYDPNHPHHGPIDPWSGVAKAVDEFLRCDEFTIDEHYLGKVAIRRI